MKVLFQGDSITDGNRGRDADPNHVLGHGYVFLLAARLGCEQPSAGHEFVNRGVSGHRVVDLYARWQEDALDPAPDLISILVGVNDVGFAFYEGSHRGWVRPDRFERVYRLLVEETRSALPEVRLVLMEPFALPVGLVARNPEFRSRLAVEQGLVRDTAADCGAAFVGLQARFDAAAAVTGPESWLWDGIHPTAAGHELVARAWSEAVSLQ